MDEYRTSGHAIWNIKYHLIWVTKYRYKILRGEVAERARVGIAGSHSSSGVGATAAVAGQVGAVREGQVKSSVAGRLSAPAQEVLGTAPVGMWLLLRDGGRSG